MPEHDGRFAIAGPLPTVMVFGSEARALLALDRDFICLSLQTLGRQR